MRFISPWQWTYGLFFLLRYWACYQMQRRRKQRISKRISAQLDLGVLVITKKNKVSPDRMRFIVWHGVNAASRTMGDQHFERRWRSFGSRSAVATTTALWPWDRWSCCGRLILSCVSRNDRFYSVWLIKRSGHLNFIYIFLIFSFL